MDDINYKILTIFQKVAFLVESEFIDLVNLDIDPEDNDLVNLEDVADEKERMKYYLGGEHPTKYQGIDYEEDDQSSTDEPFDTTEEDLLENDAKIYGNDNDPYIKDNRKIYRDIYPDITIDDLDNYDDDDTDGLDLARELDPDFDKDSIDRYDDENDL